VARRGAARRSEAGEDDEVVRLLALTVKLQVGSQAVAIGELSKIGFGPTRIAELLGTTVGTVNVTLQRQKRRSKVNDPEDTNGGK
jgi:hypothetical protein